MLSSNDDKDKRKLKSEKELDAECKRFFKKAKKMLVESGADPERVEKMGIHEVVLFYITERYNEQFSEVSKYITLPYPVAMPLMEASSQQLKDEAKDSDIEYVGALLTPFLFVAKAAPVRLEREIAALRILEALRIHAAHNNGALPEKLSDVTKVPIPNDPATGNPFEYELKNGKAYLSGARVEGSRVKMMNQRRPNYEITMKPVE